MAVTVLIKVTEYDTFGLGEVGHLKGVVICEGAFRALHFHNDDVVLGDRQTVKVRGERRYNYRPPVADEILFAEIDFGPNGRVFAAKWNFLDERNTIANRRGIPRIRIGEQLRPEECLVTVGAR